MSNLPPGPVASDIIQIVTSTDTRDVADRIAEALVEKRLAACVQVFGPVTSVYRWQGALHRGDEWLCVAKSRRHLYARVESTICELHNYEVPEILAVPVCEAFVGYLQWLDDQLMDL